LFIWNQLSGPERAYYMRLHNCSTAWKDSTRWADENIHAWDQWYKQNTENEARFDDCHHRARLDYEATNPRSTAMRLLIVIAQDLVLIGLIWLIALGCVAIVRWIRGSFVAS
jgi:hypothetical protein